MLPKTGHEALSQMLARTLIPSRDSLIYWLHLFNDRRKATATYLKWMLSIKLNNNGRVILLKMTRFLLFLKINKITCYFNLFLLLAAVLNRCNVENGECFASFFNPEWETLKVYYRSPLLTHICANSLLWSRLIRHENERLCP